MFCVEETGICVLVNVFLQSNFLAQHKRFPVVNADGYIDFLVAAFDVVGNRVYCDAQYLVLRKAECSRGDKRKRNGFCAELACLEKRIHIAAAQEHALAALSTRPYGSHRVNYVSARQLVSARYRNLAEAEWLKMVAFITKSEPCRSVYRIVRSAAARKTVVGGIDYGIAVHRRNISVYYLQWHRQSSLIVIFVKILELLNIANYSFSRYFSASI